MKYTTKEKDFLFQLVKLCDQWGMELSVGRLVGTGELAIFMNDTPVIKINRNGYVHPNE